MAGAEAFDRSGRSGVVGEGPRENDIHGPHHGHGAC